MLQLAALASAESSAALLTLDVSAAVAGLVGVPILLRRPVPTALALTLLAVVSPAATPTATAGAFHVAQSSRFRVAVGVAAVGIAAHVFREWWRPIEGPPFGWWVLLVVIAYATLVGWGRYAAARRALVASLRERARRAENEQSRRVFEARVAERARIAREMHDVLAHRLSLLATYAGALEYRPDSSPQRLSAAAGVVRAGVHQALDELRDVITLLRDDEPQGGAGTLRPQPTLVDLPRLLEESKGAGTEVRLHTTGDVAAVPLMTGRTAYRVIQEALTNARRHAPSSPVDLEIRGEPGEHLDLDVRNPLSERFAPRTDGAGVGLLGLAERVE
ncbi:MAG: sensor histidine kinase, partial [Actinomycetes bacterium]